MSIDLRSDTVTQPTGAMREAMARAQVGDDVYGEDPTVNKLERFVADLVGAEEGLFVATGTQSNLCALLSHCNRGDEYIAGEEAHTYRFEAGGAAVLGGIQPQPLPFEADGTLALDTVIAAIKPDDYHFARSRLLCLENTQAGKPLSVDYVAQAADVCSRYGLSLHLDGARLFNAAVAEGVPIAAYGGLVDSVSVCLSKGLGAPAGSVLVGSQPFIHAARRWRKMLGGGMRQAGVLAAAGLYALEHHVDRLAEDHALAVRLAKGIGEKLGTSIKQATNMVFVDVPELDDIRATLAQKNVLTSGSRWVVHLDVAQDDVEFVVNAI
ncbi:MAG: low-specificity L-threonine aldolase [Pseudomonadales bacterium]|jgi:threonine aldolase|nr:low-specificity L-threonine aldolase [Pseudomonadales bacterium]